jgi:hypothetical protein
VSWDQRFDDPIVLPDGRELVTLEDAGTYITKLPKGGAQIALINAVESAGSIA